MRWFIIAVLFAVPQFAFAGTAAVKTNTASARVYTDYCYAVGTGDVGGARITLLRFYDGDYAALQLAEGEFMVPAIGKAEINPKSGAISFDIDEASHKLSFKGVLTENRLTGRITWRENGGEPENITLTRVQNEREPVKICK